MKREDYQLVINWGDYVEKAGGLELCISIDAVKQCVVIEENGMNGAPIAEIQLEDVAPWLEGFEKARDIYRAPAELEA